MNAKIAWSGAVTAIQPRIRLTRSFDERNYTYLGYLLRIEGTAGGVSAEFRVGIGAGTQVKHQLRIGDHVEGLGDRVADPRLETADIYKVSKLKLTRRGEELATTAPWAWSASTVARLSRARTSTIGGDHLRFYLPKLYLGLCHACGDDHRPLEPRPAAL